MWRRYFYTNTQFLALLGREWLRAMAHGLHE